MVDKEEIKKYTKEFYKHADGILRIPFIKIVEIKITCNDGTTQTLTKTKKEKRTPKVQKI